MELLRESVLKADALLTHDQIVTLNPKFKLQNLLIFIKNLFINYTQFQPELCQPPLCNTKEC
jgi:hypothetical protein